MSIVAPEVRAIVIRQPRHAGGESVCKPAVFVGRQFRPAADGFAFGVDG
jgi:hypothetical protein